MAALFSILFARLSLVRKIPQIMLRALTGALRGSFSKHQPVLPTVSSDVSPDVAAEMASAKKYVLAVNEARRLALRTRRHFDMYGPPDWVDPALSILPNIGLQGDYCHGFIPPPYPFLAPHILISEPLVSDPYPVVAWTSILECQDHDYGNRLIVAQAPSVGSPLPQVYNPAPQAASTAFADEAPDGTCSASPASDVSVALDSSSESQYSECDSDSDSSSECLTVEDSRDLLEKETYPLLPASTFWIEEDDDDLPELPTDW
ncbi:hypothetical protein JB92DRAFT_2915287 [Gautieria morchelliformis]|nr:hypothetical protein JB92DRAFT_2915287 [Gautieria morchelliformis]